MNLYENALLAFESVRVCKLFHDFGRLDKLSAQGPVDEDFYWSIQFEALEQVTDYTRVRGNEYDACTTFYYQDPAMSEYYRLCRMFNERRGIGMEANPYHRESALFVHEQLCGVDSRIDYSLQTKTHHLWSCRLLIGIDGDCFYDYAGLIRALLRIFDYYRREAVSLRTELRKIGISEQSDERGAA